MLYLFGRLALSDSLTYHEDWPDEAGQRPALQRRGLGTRPDERTAAISRRLRRSRHHAPLARAISRRSS